MFHLLLHCCCISGTPSWHVYFPQLQLGVLVAQAVIKGHYLFLFNLFIQTKPRADKAADHPATVPSAWWEKQKKREREASLSTLPRQYLNRQKRIGGL